MYLLLYKLYLTKYNSIWISIGLDTYHYVHNIHFQYLFRAVNFFFIWKTSSIGYCWSTSTLHLLFNIFKHLKASLPTQFYRFNKSITLFILVWLHVCTEKIWQCKEREFSYKRRRLYFRGKLKQASVLYDAEIDMLRQHVWSFSH